jgi:hypothetical protein
VHPDRISGYCDEGRHHRCTGWMIVTNQNRRGAISEDASIACGCRVCRHPDVDVNRHLYEPIGKGRSWSSLTPTR